jgi:pimeloyl-ACP methyl ester carboxylesterase
MTVAPFTVGVSDTTLDDLRQRLVRARFATRTASAAWQSGTDPDYLRELTTYWRTTFDWRAREREINAVPHYIADVNNMSVHFVHVPGVRGPEQPPPLPLILSHGWPSSFLEMLPLVPLLTDPGRHGADPADAFDVVIPSLPGFAFSSLPRTGPVTRPFIADLWVDLMTNVLGYHRFGAYGGDIGASVTSFLGACHPSHIVGIHLIHPAMPTAIDPNQPPTAAEQAYLNQREVEDEVDGGYSAIQMTRPDTIAAALIDSPVGLAAWMVDKYRAWSDCQGDLTTRFSHDTLLTMITLYWATGTIGSSFRTYYDYVHTPPRPLVTVPTGVTLTIEDRGYPRELAERSYSDIRHWREPTVGGHFLPLEEPTLLAEELRTFFRPLRTAAHRDKL